MVIINRIKMNRSVVLAIIAVAIVICSWGCKSKGSNQTHIPKPVAFPYPTEPTIIGSLEQKNQWMSEHFWDSFFDTTRVYSPDTSFVGGVTKNDFTEAFGRYAGSLHSVSTASLLKSQAKLISKTIEAKKRRPGEIIYESIIDINEHFFYDPNSPYRSDEAYIPILEGLIESPFEDSLMKETYSKQLEMCKKNRLGQKAADFEFVTSKGKPGSLYGIKAPFIVIFFSNPLCHTCKGTVEMLSSRDEVNKMLDDGKLAIVNIFIDEDIQSWLDARNSYPQNWINCHDPEYKIREKKIYSIRAIPSLYLIDSEKNVVLKDADVEVILQNLIWLSHR